jgi:ribonuclease P protein component
MSNALRRRARLVEPKQYQALLASKPIARGERFTIHAARNHFSFARLGIIVGKRTIQKAVGRNFLKRLIRETFRHQDGLSGYDVLIRARRAVTRMESEVARLELTRLLSVVPND